MELDLVVEFVLRRDHELNKVQDGTDFAYMIPVSSAHFEPSLPRGMGAGYVTIADDVGEIVTA